MVKLEVRKLQKLTVVGRDGGRGCDGSSRIKLI